ncbi:MULTISPECIES: allantoicase [unclassified Crossiella]|uniref:allantoicase n=1 Tax=unclassified Crossiella TaxID=2620835 RepID=UPI0020002E68|nr:MULTISPECIES: allantoicase [unclassified Crossiella]MCK2243351.1 allantoicase [Crossiella sp. S99.2]MCK2254180.1 allantoicase [Crossiella sp. S99.1]
MDTALPDLAARNLGGSVLAANDEFFAEKENLIKPGPPVFRPHTFTPKGQEYDGWETRRRRGVPGQDWVIVRLGVPGIPRAIVVDTSFFKGNYPEQATVHGAALAGYPTEADLDAADWVELVPRSPLQGHTQNEFDVATSLRITHIRLTIHPDGGVARLRVHGEPLPDPRDLVGVPLDLAATANGGRAVQASDGFFSPPDNMLQPGESQYMSDGWETARRRGDGNDWAVLRLTAEAIPRVIEVSTLHYKGNSPASATVWGRTPDTDWSPLLPNTPLLPDTGHRFPVPEPRPVTEIRLDIHPDGGIGRLRVYGPLTTAGRHDLALRWFNALSGSEAKAVLQAHGLAEADSIALLHVRPATQLPAVLRELGRDTFPAPE